MSADNNIIIMIIFAQSVRTFHLCAIPWPLAASDRHRLDSSVAAGSLLDMINPLTPTLPYGYS